MLVGGRPLSLHRAARGSGVDESIVSEALTLQDWIVAASVLAVAVAAGVALQRVIKRAFDRRDADAAMAATAGRVARNLTILVGLVYALLLLEVRLTPLLGALGIGGLAVAFAAQSILENTFASILLRTRRPFQRGDQITTSEHEGTVVDVNYRTVVLRTFDGELVFVPCSAVLGNPIVNHTREGVRRTTLEVGVAYGTDLADAQQVLLRSLAAVEGVRSAPAPEALVLSFDDSQITFALRYWHQPDVASLWRVRSAVAIATKRALDDAGIEIPFPQTDVHLRPAAEDG